MFHKKWLAAPHILVQLKQCFPTFLTETPSKKFLLLCNLVRAHTRNWNKVFHNIMPSSKAKHSIFCSILFYPILFHSILFYSLSYLVHSWSKPTTLISRPTNGQCSQCEKDLGIKLGNAWCLCCSFSQVGSFLYYTSSVFEMGPSLTSKKPTEGALARKGHIAQLDERQLQTPRLREEGRI